MKKIKLRCFNEKKKEKRSKSDIHMSIILSPTIKQG